MKKYTGFLIGEKRVLCDAHRKCQSASVATAEKGWKQYKMKSQLVLLHIEMMSVSRAKQQ